MGNRPDGKIMGQGLGVIILGVMTVLLVTFPHPGYPVVDSINRIIHEAGHVFFGISGGPAMQIIIPLGITVYLKWSKRIFGMAWALFWLGEALINISFYIKDARTMLLPAETGGRYDWNSILGRLHLLSQDTTLGNMVLVTGIVIAIAGLVVIVRDYLKNTGKLR